MLQAFCYDKIFKFNLHKTFVRNTHAFVKTVLSVTIFNIIITGIVLLRVEIIAYLGF